jgi:rhodanese-related sulfurtransferase
MFTGRSGAVDVDEAYRRQQAGAMLIDVRTKPEWKEQRVPGATHMALNSLPQRAKTLTHRHADREILVICRSGSRSAKATAYLRDLGLTVRNVKGGIVRWHKRGLPVEGKAA